MNGYEENMLKVMRQIEQSRAGEKTKEQTSLSSIPYVVSPKILDYIKTREEMIKKMNKEGVTLMIKQNDERLDWDSQIKFLSALDLENEAVKEKFKKDFKKVEADAENIRIQTTIDINELQKPFTI